ncbi:molybdopterin molybdotransferase MoeA [Acinetobacter sp. MD2]|uniref:molybdopterin molybdotransferase MoeA n=1 Tax=Acinetobacter sp. MD2 TaxID=2600066 RepID=UPI002D1E70CF|nr:molybdopterin molybdotransferase MoeA [Acinetobacter sp. MD2]MEB3766700.1 molybdopterin molybdotransferase MoeA [Acinetobacter sp. MD2]
MSCSEHGLLSLDQALATYTTVKKQAQLQIALSHAHCHYLAEDVMSTIALPLFTQSAVDGYALKSEDVAAGLTTFKLVGEVRAGVSQQLEIQSGECLRIFTGGRVPESADTVARQEIVTADAATIHLNECLKQGADIRYQGEELQVGACLARRGQYLNSGVIAALSMAGVQQVNVFAQPKIAVLITGDEVSQSLENDAQVFDANAPMILAWLKEQGYQNVTLQHVIDDEAVLSQVLQDALQKHDLVITTGGVSVGDYDFIRPVSLALGAKEIFWKVAQKPGKPLYFAQYQHLNRSAYLIGLPGNPAAVFVCLALHVTTLLKALQGIAHPQPQWQRALLNDTVRLDSREQLLRMKLDVNQQGQRIVSKLKKQQSHMLSNLSEANVIVRIPTQTLAESPLEYVDCLEI